MPVLGKVGLVNKGVYAAGTTYSALDFVKYNGSTFIALKSVKGVTPADDGTNWQYLARGAELALQNNLLTTQANTYALDAAQGPVIKAALDSLKTDLADCVRMPYINGTIPANTATVNDITATVPSGYTFIGWVYCASLGWMGHVYPASNSQTTSFWTSNGNSTNARKFNAFYLVRKNA